MAVRPNGEPMEDVTESDDDVPLSRPGMRPPGAEGDAEAPDTGRDAGAPTVENSWNGYVRPKYVDEKLPASLTLTLTLWLTSYVCYRDFRLITVADPGHRAQPTT